MTESKTADHNARMDYRKLTVLLFLLKPTLHARWDHGGNSNSTKTPRAPANHSFLRSLENDRDSETSHFELIFFILTRNNKSTVHFENFYSKSFPFQQLT